MGSARLEGMGHPGGAGGKGGGGDLVSESPLQLAANQKELKCFSQISPGDAVCLNNREKYFIHLCL